MHFKQQLAFFVLGCAFVVVGHVALAILGGTVGDTKKTQLRGVRYPGGAEPSRLGRLRT